MEALRPAVQKIVDDLIDDMLAGPSPVDLVEAFALPLPSLVICELLGVPYDDHEFFQDNTRSMVRTTATPEERGAAHPGDRRIPGRSDRPDASPTRRRPAVRLAGRVKAGS